VGEDASWLAETLSLLWSQGVSLVTWDTIVDQPPKPSYLATSQSGVYFVDGRPKPALAAFRFPVVASRRDGTVQVWGRAPEAGRLTIQKRVGHTWATALSLHVNKYATFLTHFVDTSRLTVRCQLDGDISAAWSLS
jgi:hypothetical protein